MSFTRKVHISFIAITMIMLTTQIMYGAVGFCSSVEPIRIGGDFELSGSLEYFGQDATNGARLAFQEVNDSGGILGRTIDFVVLDNQSQAVGVYQVAKQLTTEVQVSAILGGVTSSNSIVLSKVAENVHIPFISPTAGNPMVTLAEDGQVKRYTFRSCLIDPYQGEIMAKFASENLGAKTAAILITSNSNYSKSVADVFEVTFLAKGNNIVTKEYYSFKDRDFRQIVMNIAQAKPDIVFIPGYYIEVGLIIAEARAQGIEVPILGCDGWDSPEIVDYSGSDALNNTYFVNHFGNGITNEHAVNFIRKYTKSYGNPPGAIAALGYESAQMVVEAIKNANSAEPEKVRDALEKIRVHGLLGDIKLDDSHNPIKSAVIMRFVDGKQSYYKTVTP